jgi:hypothetical protein
MKNWLIILVLAAQLGVLGCSGGSKDPLNDPDYLKKSEEQGKEKRQIFLRSNGDYEKMSAEDRTKFLSFFENEEDAKAFWGVMKSPPGGAPGTK